MLKALPFGLALGLLAGCALKGDVRKVELQVQALHGELARRDSVQAAERDSLLAAIRLLQRALTAQQAYLVQLRGDLRTDLINVQQQLVSVQELTGQTQQRLSEQRARLEQLAQQPVPAPANPAVTDTVARSAAPTGPSGNPAGPGPDQMYQLALQQYRGGRMATARLGFREFLRVFPTHERVADAQFYVGESFEREAPDSANAVYEQVVRAYPNSPRAPSALYKLGLLAEQRGDRAAARRLYQRVIAGYPRSPEADLARQNQQRLRP